MKIRSVLCVLLLSACQKSAPPQVQIDRTIEDLASSPIHEEITSELSAWRALGVARIRTEPADGTIDHKATLLDTQGQKVGSIEVFSSENWQSVIARVAGHQTKIEFGEGGTFQITDLTTGEFGQTKFDHNTKTFSQDPTLNKLQTKFAKIIPIAMGTLTSIKSQERSDKATEEDAPENPFDMIEPNTSAIWGCYGSWYRGGAVWGTRSECCVIARYDAAQQCSNATCIGCCDYRSCDSWCSRGDYGCVCGISGRSCG